MKPYQSTLYMGWVFSLKTSQDDMDGVAMVTHIGACGGWELGERYEGTFVSSGTWSPCHTALWLN
jgi:hypothetical protein